jgi:hypothetical protein
VARAGYGHVQSPLAALADDRPEVLRDLARRVPAVARAEDDHVALVALHRFQILDEESAGIIFP